MSNITNDSDAIRTFSDGLKRAASSAHQMGRLKKSHEWHNLAKALVQFRLNGEEAYRQRKQSRMMLLADADGMVKNMGGEEALSGKELIL